MEYQALVEGELLHKYVAQVPEDIDRSKVRFRQGVCGGGRGQGQGGAGHRHHFQVLE